MGKVLRPPPQNFTPLPAELRPDMTTRERVEEQTRAAACMNCHSLINPLGFALERFDALGRFRDTDNGRPIDDAVTFDTAAGQFVTLHGARELAELLADDSESHAAFVEQLFHHLVQQPVLAYGPQTLERLQGAFEASDLSIRALAAEIMTVTALRGREGAPIRTPALEAGGG
jgi:hypothetical protein